MASSSGHGLVSTDVVKHLTGTEQFRFRSTSPIPRCRGRGPTRTHTGTFPIGTADTLTGIVAADRDDGERSRNVVADASLEDRPRTGDGLHVEVRVGAHDRGNRSAFADISISSARPSMVRLVCSWTMQRSVMFGSPKFLKVSALQVF